MCDRIYKGKGLVIVFAMLTLGLSACSFNSPMRQYLRNIEYYPMYSYYKHAEYGTVNTQDEQLKNDIKVCSEQIQAPPRVMIGDQQISDPVMMEQIYRDYHAYLMESVMLWGAKDEKMLKDLVDKIYQDTEYKTLRREAFESGSNTADSLKIISRYIKARDNCLAEKGWTYRKRR